MKIIELKEQESLEVIEVTKHVVFHKLPNPATGEIEGNKTETVERPRIQTKIFTDGEIEKESEETTQNIEEYYIGKKKYKHGVDTLKTKKIYFKNYSYVITYLIANEFMTIGNVSGWFDIVKDVSIYLQNSKDKKALKCAKQAVKEITNCNNGVDYSTLFETLFSKGKELQRIKTKKISKNVYSLKKQSR